MAYLTKMRLNGVNYDLRDPEAHNKITILNGEVGTEGSVLNSIQDNAQNGTYLVKTKLYAWKSDEEGSALIYTKVEKPSEDATVYNSDGHVLDNMDITEVDKDSTFIKIGNVVYNRHPGDGTTDNPGDLILETPQTIKAQLDILTASVYNSDEEFNPITALTADDVAFNNANQFGPDAKNVDTALEKLWEKVFYQEPVAPTINLTATVSQEGNKPGNYAIGTILSDVNVTLTMNISNANGNPAIDPTSIIPSGFDLTPELKTKLASGDEITMNIVINSISANSNTTHQYKLEAKTLADSKGNTGSGTKTVTLTWNFYPEWYVGQFSEIPTITQENVNAILSQLTKVGLDKSNSREYTFAKVSGKYLAVVVASNKSITGVFEKATGYDVTTDWKYLGTVNGYKAYITESPKTLENFTFVFKS